jgi:hypothetical protein
MTNKHLILRCERQRASKEASSGIRGSRLPAALLNKKENIPVIPDGA